MTTIDYPELPKALDRRLQQNAVSSPAPQFAKLLIFTYTMLNTYLICPHQMYRRYVLKDLPFVETDEMKWGTQVHGAMEYRMGGKPLPADMRQWEPIAAPIAARSPKTEQQLAINREGRPIDYWDKSGQIFFRGKNDITLFHTSAASALLLDWKTGKRREDPFELATNAMLIHAHNPHLTSIKGHYVWLKENALGAPHDVSDTRSTWAKVNNLAEEIKDCQSSNEWVKKKGPLCGYCNVVDCENRFDARA